MIVGLLHDGSGLGNQLHTYIMTRIIALEKGYNFGFVGQFKGDSFMNVDKGQDVSLSYKVEQPAGKIVIKDKIPLFEEMTDYYNPEVNFIQDNTIIDGYFQDERYFESHLDEVREWLKTDPLEMPDDLCVIGFRGGEYVGIRDLFLGLDYWGEAINKMKEYNPKMKFEVHTDDVLVAQRFFPKFKVTHEIGTNWRSARYAKNLILSNSSFFIFPALLGEAKHIIAPRGWGRYNLKNGTWLMPQNYYKRFEYI